MKISLKAAALVATALSWIPALAGGPLRVALVGDPQVDNVVEMGYARRSVYRELAGRKDIDLCIFLGDLVNDDMALLPESVQVIDSLPFTSLMVPGNHDRDVYRGVKALHMAGASTEVQNRPRDLATWRMAVGYVDTSFVRGNVRFILMNNVRRANAGMTDYVGGFTAGQKHWLDSVLRRDATAPSHRRTALTLLATHIPVSQMKGRDSVLALIPDLSRVLLVSGHTHYVARGYVEPSAGSGSEAVSGGASELIVGATCGSWWRGVKDASGVPYALQSCGAPRGYFIADIRRNGDYLLSYKCVGRPKSEQLSVWAVPEVSASTSAEAGRSRDEHGQRLAGDTGRLNNDEDSDRLRYRFYINVFGGSADGTVDISVPRRSALSFSIDNEAIPRHLHCPVSSATAPEVEEVIRFNASMSREYRKAHRDEFIPLRRKSSPHLWQSEEVLHGEPPTYVNVRYRDANMRFRTAKVQVNVLK